MVDQNANANVPTSDKPAASARPKAKDGLSAPTVIKAGEAMLIISLVLIFLVCCTVCVHLYLKRRRRRRRIAKKAKREKDVEQGDSEPEVEQVIQGKDIAELVGTPMCEMGDSDPRHEMEDAEVDERHLQAVVNEGDTTSQVKDRFSWSESETESQIGTEMGISWYDDSEERVEPDSRELAMYWARAM